jgi:D-alanine-D-alanine ligase
MSQTPAPDFKNARVGVLLGGMSTERNVSKKSGAAVAKALRSLGYDVVEIDVGPDLPEKLRADIEKALAEKAPQ